MVGGGLIRSLGGWSKVRTLRKGGPRLKGDERILGDSEFVLEVLEACQERLARWYDLQSQGYDLKRVAGRVASLYGIEPREIYLSGKDRQRVEARSLFCYWAVQELGITATSLARKLNLSHRAVSQASGGSRR